MEEDRDATDRLLAELRKEDAAVERIASGFHEMPLPERLGYVSAILGPLAYPTNRVPGQAPMEIRVAYSVVR